MKNPTLQNTVMLMMQCHHGMLDKGGYPYFMHPLRVMFRLGPKATIFEKEAALMHDTVEDTWMTIQALDDRGFSPATVEMVRLLTREPGISYKQYIDRIIASNNVGAMRVKLADSADNSCWSRVRHLPADDQSIMERYAATAFKLDTILETYGLANSVIRGDLAL